MKIDKKTIESILQMNDEQLWKVIQHVASKSGNSSLFGLEKPNDMTKIRQTLSSLTEEQINNALNKFNDGRNKK